VTVKQIIECEETYGGSNDFRIDGAQLTQVTFVGQVRAVTQQSTHINYKLEDGTGVIEVKKWIDTDKMQTADDAGAGGDPLLELDSYVRVWGRLRSFNNKKHIGAHVMRPVTDPNEVNYHLLEATYVHLYFTRGPPGGGGQQNNGAGGGGDGDGMFVDGYGAGGQTAKTSNASHMPNLSVHGQKMYNFLLRTPGGNEGVHTDLIAQGTAMSARDVRAAMDELLAAGVVYTTLDDDTFAVLET
jgi:hypothetical protein